MRGTGAFSGKRGEHFQLAEEHGGLPLRHSVIRAEHLLFVFVGEAGAAAVSLGLKMFEAGEAGGEDDASFARRHELAFLEAEAAEVADGARAAALELASAGVRARDRKSVV